MPYGGAQRTFSCGYSEMKDYQALIEHALTLPASYRENVAREAIKIKIVEAKAHKIANSMAPSVFKAITLSGEYHVGFNFQPQGTQVGFRFHYDHGVGIEKNDDAEVVWIMSEEGERA